MPVTGSSNRRRPGEVRDAIVAALKVEGRPLTIAELCETLSEALDGPVPASSVRSYLRLNCGPGDHFKRVGRGAYELRG